MLRGNLVGRFASGNGVPVVLDGVLIVPYPFITNCFREPRDYLVCWDMHSTDGVVSDYDMVHRACF